MKVTTTEDKLPDIIKAIHDLVGVRVQVGVPSTKTDRDDGPLTNADLAYIHEFGAPAANIPARPFLVPGIEEGEDKIVKQMERATKAALRAKPAEVDQALHGVGLVAQNNVKLKINNGPFEALSEVTLKYRMARGRTGTKPLIDTGQLRNAISYAIVRVK